MGTFKMGPIVFGAQLSEEHSNVIFINEIHNNNQPYQFNISLLL